MPTDQSNGCYLCCLSFYSKLWITFFHINSRFFFEFVNLTFKSFPDVFIQPNIFRQKYASYLMLSKIPEKRHENSNVSIYKNADGRYFVLSLELKLMKTKRFSMMFLAFLICFSILLCQFAKPIHTGYYCVDKNHVSKAEYYCNMEYASDQRNDSLCSESSPLDAARKINSSEVSEFEIIQCEYEDVRIISVLNYQFASAMHLYFCKSSADFCNFEFKSWDCNHYLARFAVSFRWP